MSNCELVHFDVMTPNVALPHFGKPEKNNEITDYTLYALGLKDQNELKAKMEAIMKAVMSRYNALYPEWELNTFSILKSEDRTEQFERMITVLEKMKDLSK